MVKLKNEDAWRKAHISSSEMVQGAVDGRAVNLLAAFSWESSPQGHDYWKTQRKHMERNLGLTDEAKAHLLEALAVAKVVDAERIARDAK